MLDLPTPATSSDGPISPDFESFRACAGRLTGLDLTAYKAPQMQRRLAALLARLQVPTFAEYAELLARDPLRRQEFREYATIGVSEFFRDAERFAELERRVLPELLAAAGRRGLRVWSAGCSMGAEPYSIAMLLSELAPGSWMVDPTRRDHAVLATDVDEAALVRAQVGADYTPGEVRNVTPARLARWFVRQPDATYAVAAAPRALVTFHQHDLLRDALPAGPFDLIACRNVVIYFTEAAKERIYAGFVQALRPGGVLFLGGTEVILKPRAVQLAVLGPGFYRRVDSL